MELKLKWQNPFKRQKSIDFNTIPNPFESKDKLLEFLGKTMAAVVLGKIDVPAAESAVLLIGKWEAISPFNNWAKGRQELWNRTKDIGYAT